MEYLYLLIASIVFGGIGYYITHLRYKAHMVPKDVFENLQTENIKNIEKLSSSLGNIEKLESQNRTLIDENKQLLSELSSKKTEIAGLESKLEEQKGGIEKIHENIKKEFELLASKALKTNSEEFKESSTEMINSILNPFKDKLEHFQKDVQSTRETHIKESAQLREQITNLVQTSQTMVLEASNLTNALKKDSKARGNWGEMILESILTKSGLLEGDQYTVQKEFKNDDGEKLKPDVVVYLPGQKNLIIDSKVQLLAYDSYANTEDENERATFLKAHIEAMDVHIKGLSGKNYSQLHGINSPDFVLMFVAIEPAFNIALEKDISLYNKALEKGIVLVTPSTLIATLKIVHMIWRQENQNQNALEIAETGGKLYDKLVGYIKDMENVGSSLNKTKENYDKAFKKLYSGKGNAIDIAEKMKTLGAKSTKEIPQNLNNE